MILDCPFCKARFLIAASVFASGPRRVRCGRCAHSWEASPPNNIEVVALPLMEADIQPIPDQPPPPLASGANLPAIPPAPMSKLVRLLMILGIILGIIATILIGNRETIAGRWPAFEKAYNAVGLHINHTGEDLRIEDVRSELRYDAGIVRLVVEGNLRNVAEKYQLVPNIKASAIGPDGSEIQSWQIDAPVAKLAPGETVPFETAIKAPDKTVVNVNLEFIELKNDDE